MPPSRSRHLILPAMSSASSTVSRVSVSFSKTVNLTPLEPHGSEIRDRGVFFCAEGETGRLIPSLRNVLRHIASSLGSLHNLRRGIPGTPICTPIGRSVPKVSLSGQRQRVRVKWWSGSLRLFGVFKTGLEKPILPGYQNCGHQRLRWHRYRETRWHVAVAI